MVVQLLDLDITKVLLMKICATFWFVCPLEAWPETPVNSLRVVSLDGSVSFMVLGDSRQARPEFMISAFPGP